MPRAEFNRPPIDFLGLRRCSSARFLWKASRARDSRRANSVGMSLSLNDSIGKCC